MFPLTSVTVHITDVVPTGNCRGALLNILSTPQLSVAIGCGSVTTPVCKAQNGIVNVVSCEQKGIAGNSLSVISTVKLHEADKLVASVTMNETVEIPRLKG